MTERNFAAWLREIMPKLEVTDARGLRQALLDQGCPVSEVALSDWLEEVTEPSFDKMRAVLGSLNRALPDVDVWEAYDRFVRGEPERAQDPAPHQIGTPSLDELIRDPRLPPGLTP